MALLGNYLTVRLQQHSSGTANEIIAESTSVDAQFNAEALETTEQADALESHFIVGKNTIQVSGDYLLASDGEQFDNLFVHANAGNKIEVELYRSGTKFLDTEGVFTSLADAGALSDSLVTGAYSMELDVVAVSEYGSELYTQANAISITNEADAITGWSESLLNGTGSNVFESQGAVKSDGSYAWHINANDTPSANARVYNTLDGAPTSIQNGDEVKIELDLRHVGTATGDGDWSFYLADGSNDTDHLVGTVTKTDITFQTFSIEFTYDNTYQFMVIRENNAQNDGGVYADKLSVKKKP